MLYRLIRAVHRAYALTLFWLYVAAFIVAFCFVFMLPIVTLALLFVALFGLVFAFFGKRLLATCENVLARAALSRGVCPRCRMADHLTSGAGDRRQCEACGSQFEPWGAERELDETSVGLGSV